VSYDNDNIFAKILREDAPCFKIYEDADTLAFLDVMPQMDGHTLVIPKEPAVTIYDLTDQASLACMRTVKIVGRALEKATNFAGTSVFQHNGRMAGQSVPHFHFHVLPGSIFNSNVIRGHASEMADPSSLEKMAAKIRACIAD